MKIRAEFFQLINSLIDHLVLNKTIVKIFSNDIALMQMIDHLKAKIVPLVFYACDEDNHTCSYFAWNSIAKLLNGFLTIEDHDNQMATNFWQLINVKKAFVPKLIALLRRQAKGEANSQNIEIVYSTLPLLVSKLSDTFTSDEEKSSFYIELFSRISDALIIKEQAPMIRVNASNRIKILSSFFDCLSLVLENDQSNIRFGVSSIVNHVLPLCESYLDSDNPSDSNEEEDIFELKLRIFINKIVSVKPELIECFYNGLKELINNKLSFHKKSSQSESSTLDQLDLARKKLKIFSKYCALFKRVELTEQHILNELLIERFLLGFQNEQNPQINLDVLSVYLKGLIVYTAGSLEPNIIDLIASEHINTQLSQREKLAFVNENFIEKAIQFLYDLPLCNDESKIIENTSKPEIIYGLVDLFIILNITDKDEKKLKLFYDKLDAYLLVTATNKRGSDTMTVQNFLENYFESVNIGFKEIGNNVNINKLISEVLIDWIVYSETFYAQLVKELFEGDRLFCLELQLGQYEQKNNLNTVESSAAENKLAKKKENTLNVFIIFLESLKNSMKEPASEIDRQRRASLLQKLHDSLVDKCIRFIKDCADHCRLIQQPHRQSQSLRLRWLQKKQTYLSELNNMLKSLSNFIDIKRIAAIDVNQEWSLIIGVLVLKRALFDELSEDENDVSKEEAGAKLWQQANQLDFVRSLETTMNVFVDKSVSRLTNMSLLMQKNDRCTSLNVTAYKPLVDFVKTNLIELEEGTGIDTQTIVSVVVRLVRLLAKKLETECKIKSDELEARLKWLDSIYANVIFTLDVSSLDTNKTDCSILNYRKVYRQILKTKTSEHSTNDERILNKELLANLYSHEKFSFFYLPFYSEMLNNHESIKEPISLDALKQLYYGLGVLNGYLSSDRHGLALIEAILCCQESSNSILNLKNFLFMILSSIVLVEFTNSRQQVAAKKQIESLLISGIFEQMNQLLDRADFVRNLLSRLRNDEKCIRQLADGNSLLEAQSISLLFACLLEKYSRRVENYETLANEPLVETLNELAIKLANMCDTTTTTSATLTATTPVSFKSSMREVSYHHRFLLTISADTERALLSLNEQLTSKAKIMRETIKERLNALNKDSSADYVEESLRVFNSSMCAINQGLNDYLSLVNQDRLSPPSLDLVRNNLGPLVNQLIADFIELKSSTPASYMFYFDLGEHSLTKSVDKEWQEFLLTVEVNKFLTLLFVDFKVLQTAGSGNKQQLSLLLSDKSWDFVLCYAAFVAQRFNKISNVGDLLFGGDKLSVRLYASGYFALVARLVKCMQNRVLVEKSSSDSKGVSYPRSLSFEWNGLFAKEVLDPILCIYVHEAERYSTLDKADNHQWSLINTLKNLCYAASLIPFERLLFNSLETKLNVLDLTAEKNRALQLGENLMSVMNHLTPMLKHSCSFVQLSAYALLKNIMENVNGYYLPKESDDENDAIKIIDSLPHIVRDTLAELIDLLADLKTTIPFDQCILVSEDGKEEIESLLDEAKQDEENGESQNVLRHNINKKLMSCMLIGTLVLDMCSTADNLQFKVRLVNELKALSYSDSLLNCLYRLMPLDNSTVSSCFFASNTNMSSVYFEQPDYHSVSFSNEYVQMYACRLYKEALKSVPAIIRDWWHMQNKRIADIVEKYTTKHVSPTLIDEEIREINRSARNLDALNANAKASNQPILIENKAEIGSSSSNSAGMANLGFKKTIILDDEENQSSIHVKGMVSTREIVSTYRMKELNMELIIQLPVNYPLGVISVSSVRRLGVSENEWRNWLLQLTTYLIHQNGSIMQALLIWKKNVDKKFSGVEECTICYNVIHGTNYQLPKMKCRTCRKLFHSVCLYKWFESSSKSTCPLCRNLF
jgi:E3 ubiquitin-protein ligase listerin